MKYAWAQTFYSDMLYAWHTNVTEGIVAYFIKQILLYLFKRSTKNEKRVMVYFNYIYPLAKLNHTTDFSIFQTHWLRMINS